MSASSKKVRLAIPEDIPQLLEIGRELHSENGLMPLDEENILSATIRGVNRDGAIVGVIGDVGAIEGLIYLVIGQFWYSKAQHLEELFSYVRPQFRKSDNAKVLIKFAKDTAEQLDVPLLIGIVSNIDTKRKIRLYERILGEPAGAYFLVGARTGSW